MYLVASMKIENTSEIFCTELFGLLLGKLLVTYVDYLQNCEGDHQLFWFGYPTSQLAQQA